MAATTSRSSKSNDHKRDCDASQLLSDSTVFKVMHNCDFDEITKGNDFPPISYTVLRLRQFYEWANRNNNHPLTERIEQKVWHLMEYIQCKLAEAGLDGDFLKGGSYYEGVKVGYPDEFDYMFELRHVKLGDFVITQANPATFKPRTQKQVVPRSYYTVQTRPAPVESKTLQWLRSEGSTGEATQAFVDARKVIASFSQLLRKILGKEGDVHADLSGPAVTLYLTLTSKIFDMSNLDQQATSKMSSLMQRFQTVPIKVDIVLAIPLRLPVEDATENGSKGVQRTERQKDSTDKSHSQYKRQFETGQLMWPLDGIGNVKLTRRITDTIHKCHLVASEDYWKASFAETETKMMQDAPRQAKNVFMALKVSSI